MATALHQTRTPDLGAERDFRLTGYADTVGLAIPSSLSAIGKTRREVGQRGARQTPGGRRRIESRWPPIVAVLWFVASNADGGSPDGSGAVLLAARAAGCYLASALVTAS
jgi:hypothetical protein